MRNAALQGSHAPEIVFVGVGLTLADRRRNGSPQWGQSLRKARPTDPGRAAEETSGGWFGGERPPEITSEERAWGDALYPGESVVYEITVPTDDLPFAHIAVEGTVSYRHLFRIRRPVEGLESHVRPVVVDALRRFNTLDIHGPHHAVAYTMPNFGPGTTQEELEDFRRVLPQAREELDALERVLHELRELAPTPRIQEHLQLVVARYLEGTKRLIEEMITAVSSGNLRQMEAVASSIEERGVEAERVNRLMEGLITSYGLSPEETGYRFGP